MAALATLLLDQARVGNDNVVRQRFAHVVDRQRSNASAGERFHFYAGFMMNRHCTVNDRFIVLHIDMQFAVFNTERMTEGYQLMGALGSQRAGDDRGVKHRSLAGAEVLFA